MQIKSILCIEEIFRMQAEAYKAHIYSPKACCNYSPVYRVPSVNEPDFHLTHSKRISCDLTEWTTEHYMSKCASKQHSQTFATQQTRQILFQCELKHKTQAPVKQQAFQQHSLHNIGQAIRLTNVGNDHREDVKSMCECRHYRQESFSEN